PGKSRFHKVAITLQVGRGSAEPTGTWSLDRTCEVGFDAARDRAVVANHPGDVIGDLVLQALVGNLVVSELQEEIVETNAGFALFDGSVVSVGSTQRANFCNSSQTRNLAEFPPRTSV